MAWEIEQEEVSEGVVFSVYNEQGQRVTDPYISEQDAALIVKAVNAHEAMKEALERQCDNMAFVLNHAELHNFYDKFSDELEQDRKALSLAEGVEP